MSYQYDLNGYLIESIEQGLDGGERKTTYARDIMGRLVEKTLPDDTKITYQYNARGQL